MVATRSGGRPIWAIPRGATLHRDSQAFMAPSILLLVLAATAADAPLPDDPDASFVSSCPALQGWPPKTGPDRTKETAANRPEQVAALEAWLFPEGLDWDVFDRCGCASLGRITAHWALAGCIWLLTRWRQRR